MLKCDTNNVILKTKLLQISKFSVYFWRFSNIATEHVLVFTDSCYKLSRALPHLLHTRGRSLADWATEDLRGEVAGLVVGVLVNLYHWGEEGGLAAGLVGGPIYLGVSRSTSLLLEVV